MNEDDSERDNGIGAVAAFQLGRWSAESDVELDQTMSRLRQTWRGNPTVAEYISANKALAADNRSLLAENAQLRSKLEEYKHNYGRLRAWAERIQPLIRDAD